MIASFGPPRTGQQAIVGILGCLAAIGLVGCGAPSSTFDLAGEVTLGGLPVVAGEIVFEPDAEQGNRGPGAVAEIVDGWFETEPGRGVVGGPYRVRIVAFDGRPVGDPKTELLDPRGQPMAGEVELRLDLPRTSATRNFALPAGSPQ
jgi:hypothetical protein